MFYPVYVNQQDGSAFGAVLPDLPGVHAAADDAEALPRMIQEAVELMYDGETRSPPAPSTVSIHYKRPRYTKGFWMLVDIDLSRVNTRAEPAA